MRSIDGIHHITLITGDAPANVDFYVRVLGLRLVKKTVNQDDPGVYHLYYADEHGSPGADITFFEYPGATPRQAGAGMVTAIVHRVGSDEALDFWAERLAGEGIATERADGRLRLLRSRGHAPRARGVRRPDAPLTRPLARDPRTSSRCRGSRACAALVGRPDRRARPCCARCSASPRSQRSEWEARGRSRGGRIRFETATERGIPGAGTVHHIAWAVPLAEMERLARAGDRGRRAVRRR